MKKNPVQKGIKYENLVIEILQECGIEAWRTNVTNEADLEHYKHGFDGGVDVIARYSVKGKVYKDFVFYIQCKCWNGKDLTKSAISEVYAGMHARNGFSKGSIPVVFATTEASEETRNFAKSLGVELILNREMELIKHARISCHAVYSNYGVLMKIIMYHYTKDESFIDTLPDTYEKLSRQSEIDDLITQTEMDFYDLQAELDDIHAQELKLQQKRQKNLDKTKLTVFRNIQTVNQMRAKNKEHGKGAKPTIDKESG